MAQNYVKPGTYVQTLYFPPGSGKSFSYQGSWMEFTKEFNPVRDLLPALAKIHREEQAEMEAAWKRIVNSNSKYLMKFYSKELFIKHVKQRRQERKGCRLQKRD